MAEKIWLKRVLIPLWFLQLAAAIILAIAFGLLIWVVDQAQNNRNGLKKQDLNGNGTYAKAVAAVILAAAVVTILMIVVEIILAATHKLKPLAHIVLQSIKTTIWTVLFVVTVISAAESHAGGLSIFLQLLLFLTSLGQLIYGAVILHRYRKGTLYKNSTTYELQEGPVKH